MTLRPEGRWLHDMPGRASRAIDGWVPHRWSLASPVGVANVAMTEAGNERANRA